MLETITRLFTNNHQDIEENYIMSIREEMLYKALIRKNLSFIHRFPLNAYIINFLIIKDIKPHLKALAVEVDSICDIAIPPLRSSSVRSKVRRGEVSSESAISQIVEEARIKAKVERIKDKCILNKSGIITLHLWEDDVIRNSSYAIGDIKKALYNISDHIIVPHYERLIKKMLYYQKYPKNFKGVIHHNGSIYRPRES